MSTTNQKPRRIVAGGERSLAEESRKKLIETARSTGATNTELAQQFGVSRATIRRALEAAGIQRNTRHGITPEETQQAASAYRAGSSLSKISQDTGRSTATIKTALINAGVQLSAHYGALSEEQSKSIVGLFVNEKLSVREIADKAGVTSQTVRNHLRNTPQWKKLHPPRTQTKGAARVKSPKGKSS